MATPRKTYSAKHRAPDSPDDYWTTRGEGRRRPDKHDTPKPRKKAAKKAPVSATPVTAPLSAPRAPARRRTGGGGGESERGHVLREEGAEYARRAAIRSGTGGKPSVTGRAAAGGIGGASAGAAIGSVVPGVGTAAGAAVGGGIGTVGGAISGAKAKRAYKAAMRTNGQMRRVIVAEFAVCTVVAALSPLTDRDEKPGAFMKRMTAIMGLFLILGLISGMGRTASRVSAGLGGLVMVGLLVSERNLFIKLAQILGSTDDKPAPGTGPSDTDVGADVGSTAGGVLGQVD